MRKYGFLILLTLFLILPFNVFGAEIIEKNEIVYVIEDIKPNCDEVKEPIYQQSKIEGKIVVIDDYDNEYYIYDVSTKKCSNLLTEEEKENYLYDYSNNKLIVYEIRENKLYKVESDHRIAPYEVEKQCDNTNSVEKCFETKYFITTFGDPTATYKPWYNNIAEKAEEGYCADSNNHCLKEVNYDEYVKETILTDIDKTKFDLIKDGFPCDINSAIIQDYFIINGKEYIVIRKDVYSSWIYEISGKKVLPIDGEQVNNNGIKGINEKYILYTGLSKDSINFGTIYDYNLNELYKVTNAAFMYLTTYENNVILLKGEEIDNKVVTSLTFIKDYRLLEGDNQTYQNNDLTFKFSGEYELLDNIKIDDKVLEDTNYTLKKGSTVITLKDDYLNTLSNGEHKLTVNYKDGGYSSVKFKVENQIKNIEKVNIETPQTSDGIIKSIFICVISLIGIIGITLYYKKHMS